MLIVLPFAHRDKFYAWASDDAGHNGIYVSPPGLATRSWDRLFYDASIVCRASVAREPPPLGLSSGCVYAHVAPRRSFVVSCVTLDHWIGLRL